MHGCLHRLRVEKRDDKWKNRSMKGGERVIIT